jgi:hypothetical protein
MGTWIYIVGFHRRVKVPSVRSILFYYLMRIGSWDLPNMGDSIGDSIVTPYITNFLGKDPNRCQMTRMFCWPSTFVVSFYLFVDEASERKVSTFLINFRKQFPTLVC